ncbi:MAG: competence/damage-inducible protein A [Deltaproteobacteria bacterium]|nr:competence/damage-inducible protein A [Deltaproteobacteria bacterium]
MGGADAAEGAEGAAPTAAIIIIGDEILRGKFVDENSPYLLRRLREIGIDVLRVEVIPDQLEVIAEVVRRWSAAVDHVFTTGGVGPTHDDLTMQGVSRAFGLRCALHPELDALLRARMGEAYNTAAARMAEVPEGAELIWGGAVSFPQVRARNVFIFPGVPKLLKLKFEAIAGGLTGAPVLSRRITTTAQEPEIADLLTAAAARWPSVDIGSYPQFDRRPWTVTITLDSRDATAIAACFTHLEEQLRSGIVEVTGA